MKQETGYPYCFQVVDAAELDKVIMKYCGNHPVVIYGAAECGCRCMQQLLWHGLDIRYFVDRNPYWQKDTPFFKPVLSFEQFRENYQGEVVLVASYKSEVAEEISKEIQAFVPGNKVIAVPITQITGRLPLPESFERYRGRESLNNGRQSGTLLTVVSVIYNTPEEYLRRAIESVLNQTYGAFEYLIVDHGCQDDHTAKIIREYAEQDDRIRVVRTEKNYVNELRSGREKDLSKLYQVYVENIKSRFVCTIDSDDCYATDFLQRAMEALEKEQADTYYLGAVSYGEETYQKGECWLSFQLPPQVRVAERIQDRIFLYANAIGSIGGWAMVTKTDLFLKGYSDMWVNTDLTSDLKSAYRVMKESDKCVFGNTVSMYYTNRKGAGTGILKSNIKQRLFNLIDVCLIQRCTEMLSFLQQEGAEDRLVLYTYIEYWLMVIKSYLDEIKAAGVYEENKELIAERLQQLKTLDLIAEVIKSRQNYKEFAEEVTKG